MAPLAADPATTRALPAASDPRAEFKALLEAWDREQAARATQTLPATAGSAAAAPPAQ